MWNNVYPTVNEWEVEQNVCLATLDIQIPVTLSNILTIDIENFG